MGNTVGTYFYTFEKVFSDYASDKVINVIKTQKEKSIPYSLTNVISLIDFCYSGQFKYGTTNLTYEQSEIIKTRIITTVRKNSSRLKNIKCEYYEKRYKNGNNEFRGEFIIICDF